MVFNPFGCLDAIHTRHLPIHDHQLKWFIFTGGFKFCDSLLPRTMPVRPRMKKIPAFPAICPLKWRCHPPPKLSCPRSSDAGLKRFLALSFPRPKLAVKLKVLPWPGWLSTQISPPIISASRLLIVNPRPVPPYLRVVEESACAKG